MLPRLWVWAYEQYTMELKGDSALPWVSHSAVKSFESFGQEVNWKMQILLLFYYLKY